MDKVKTVLFICTHNAARSQMAEGLLNALCGSRYHAFSAGIEPRYVHRYAMEVMGEIDIDISEHRSKGLDEFGGQDFDYVVTVCDNARENCPYLQAKVHLHESFTDPASIDEFRLVRDELREWLERAFCNLDEKYI